MQPREWFHASLLASLPLVLAGNSLAEELRVSPLGGGAHVTIQAAVDAAQSGDTISIGAGDYPGFTIDGKSLKLIARPGAQVRVLGEVHVTNLPVGGTLVIDGVEVRSAQASKENVQADAKKEPENPYPVLAFEECSEGLPTKGTWSGYPKLHDLNGDGYADLVASNRKEDGYSVWLAPIAGMGAWTLKNEGLPRTMGFGSAGFEDFDSDGDVDLAVNSHKDGLRLFLNDGELNWTETYSPIENLFLLLDIAVADINGDWHPDIVGIGHFKGGISLFAGDGAGSMRRMPESSSVMDQGAFGREIQMADINGDGIDDILCTSILGLKVFLTHPGASPFWEDISENLPNPAIGNSIFACGAGDFTGDGKLEIVFGALPSERKPENRNTIGVFALGVQGAAQERWVQIDTGLPREAGYRDVKIGDLNGDGHLDLLALSLSDGPIIYLGDGNAGFLAAGRLDWTGPRRADLGDVNGDGLLDVALTASARKPKPGGVKVFLNRPGAFD